MLQWGITSCSPYYAGSYVNHLGQKVTSAPFFMSMSYKTVKSSPFAPKKTFLRIFVCFDEFVLRS